MQPRTSPPTICKTLNFAISCISVPSQASDVFALGRTLADLAEAHAELLDPSAQAAALWDLLKRLQVPAAKFSIN